MEAGHDVSCASGKTGSCPKASHSLEEEQLRVAGTEPKSCISQGHPGKRNDEHAERTETICEATAGHLYQRVGKEDGCCDQSGTCPTQCEVFAQNREHRCM